MSGNFFKTVDYVQSGDSRQGATPLNDEPDPVITSSYETSSYETSSYGTCTHYQQSLSGVSGTSRQLYRQAEKTPYQLLDRTDTATHPAVNWYAPMSSTSKLTTQNDFKRMGKPKERVTLTEQQKSVLSSYYDRCQYIKTNDVNKIVDTTGLTIKQVRSWFNNRRAAAKKKSSSSSQSVSCSSK